MSEKSCPKCGYSINDDDIICMNCGYGIKDEHEVSESINDLKEKQPEREKNAINTELNIRGLGVFLLIAGGLCDVISMFLIFSGDYEIFGALTIGGTIAFILGLALTFGSHFL